MNALPRLAARPLSAAWRRLVLLLLVGSTTAAGTWLLLRILLANGLTSLEAAILPIFALTFGWVVLSFWCAVIGFLLRLGGLHPVTLRRESAANVPLPALRRRHAILVRAWRAGRLRPNRSCRPEAAVPFPERTDFLPVQVPLPKNKRVSTEQFSQCAKLKYVIDSWFSLYAFAA